MKKLASLIIFIVAMLPASSFCDENLVGIWSAKIRTKGGLGGQWIFFKGGDVSYTFGALVDFKYEIDGDFLIMHMAESEKDKDKIIKKHYTISNDTLTIQAEGSENTQVMKWAGVPTKTNHPLIGNWTYPHYTGQTALMRYTSQGLAQLTVPFIVENGRYSIQGDKVFINFRNKEPIEYLFKRNEKRLSIKDMKRGENTELELLEY